MVFSSLMRYQPPRNPVILDVLLSRDDDDDWHVSTVSTDPAVDQETAWNDADELLSAVHAVGVSFFGDALPTDTSIRLVRLRGHVGVKSLGPGDMDGLDYEEEWVPVKSESEEGPPA